MGSLSYLEGRLNKMYEESRGKLRERRRQDVRDQADILAAQSAASFSLSMDLVQVRQPTMSQKNVNFVRYFAKMYGSLRNFLKIRTAILVAVQSILLLIWSRIPSDAVSMDPGPINFVFETGSPHDYVHAVFFGTSFTILFPFLLGLVLLSDLDPQLDQE